jgi:hypothetical protein
MEADQDIVDYLAALQHESAVQGQQRNQQAGREAWAASARARLH